MLVIVGASIILPYFETGVGNFGDGLWYCFMIVTTIGLGDIAAATTIGRLITIVVRLYGIVVFALITSIFVNLYNENKDKESSKKDTNANTKKDQL